MKLNIYDKKRIVKTYTADAYDLELGPVEDIIKVVELDKLKNGTQEEILGIAMNAISHSLGTIKDLMRDIFDGLTDEELRHVHIVDLASVLVDVIAYAISQLRGGSRKN